MPTGDVKRANSGLTADDRSQHGSSIDTEILIDLSLSKAMAQMPIIATHLRDARRGLKTDVDAEVHDLMDEHASVCPCQFPYFDCALQICGAPRVQACSTRPKP